MRRSLALRPGRFCWLCLLSVAVLLGAGASVRGQGLLVNVTPGERAPLPRLAVASRVAPPPESYKIKEILVQTRIVDQVAQTQVNQSFVNTGSRVMEVAFVFPLPYDGAIDQLTLLVDGREYPAKLLPADEARRTYEDIVRKNQDPALLEWIGAGMFKTSVFPVPPGAERKVTLRYSQLCRKDHGLTDYLFPLATAKYTSAPVESIRFQVSIESGADIKNVYSPSHAVEIKRPDNHHATVSFTAANQIPSADFRLFYDVAQGQLATSLLSFRPRAGEDGYFLLLASPDIRAADVAPPSKTVVFVVDRSGSMSGKKFEQARAAMAFVLNNLRAGDLFNVIAYDSQVESFRPELQRFDDDTRNAALGFVNGLYPGGSTNIDGALRAALTQLKDNSRPNFVIFLTDGLPTDGERNETKIVANAKSANGVHARVFTFGVGYDVNSRLLDKLARANFGLSEYVRPEENVEASVSALYNRIGAPVLTDLAIAYDLAGQKPADGPAVSRIYPGDAHDLFAGEQLVIVGRYRQPGAVNIAVSGRVSSETKRFEFPATFVEHSADDTHSFIERLWATRRAGEIIDELDLKGHNDELVKELIQLSTRHGVLTPYTSFMADDGATRRDMAANVREANRGLAGLQETDGRGGVAQRSAKGALQRAKVAAPSAAMEPARFREAEAAARPRATSAAPSSPLNGPIAGAGGAMGGMSRQSPAAGGSSPAAPAQPLAASDRDSSQRVQTIGRKTFFLQGAEWVDTQVTPEHEKQAIKLDRFGADYFELIEKHGREVAKYLAIDEPLLIEIGGQAYRF